MSIFGEPVDPAEVSARIIASMEDADAERAAAADSRAGIAQAVTATRALVAQLVEDDDPKIALIGQALQGLGQTLVATVPGLAELVPPIEGQQAQAKGTVKA